MGPLFHCSSDPTFRRVLTQCRFRNSGLVFLFFSHSKKKQYCSVNLDHPLPTPDFSEKKQKMCQQISVQPRATLIRWLLFSTLPSEKKISWFWDFIPRSLDSLDSFPKTGALFKWGSLDVFSWLVFNPLGQKCSFAGNFYMDLSKK